MNQNLKGKKVAILVADGFEQSEFEKPRQALIDAGAETVVVSPVEEQVTAWDGNTNDFGDAFDVDLDLDAANADDFDALLLPGGVKNPDTLRGLPKAVNFVRVFSRPENPSVPSATRSLAACGSRRRARPQGHLVSYRQDRSQKRRRPLGRRGSRYRPRPRHQP